MADLPNGYAEETWISDLVNTITDIEVDLAETEDHHVADALRSKLSNKRWQLERRREYLESVKAGVES